MSEYTRYHIMGRVGEASMMRRSKKLFQQYIADQYARAESQDFGFLKSKAIQTKFRRDTHINVMHYVLSGRQNILPSSHTGSDRWYHKKMKMLWQL